MIYCRSFMAAVLELIERPSYKCQWLWTSWQNNTGGSFLWCEGRDVGLYASLHVCVSRPPLNQWRSVIS